MGAKCLPAAAKKDAISSPPKPFQPPRGWLGLYRVARTGRHAWVISVPKKIIPTSVRRSRLRRLIREAARKLGVAPPDPEMWRFAVRRDPSKGIKTAEVVSIMAELIEKNNG